MAAEQTTEKTMIEIKYTIENTILIDQFQYTLEMKTVQRPFIPIMDEAVDRDRHFWFAFTEYEELGAGITIINGLELRGNKSYWQLVKRDSDGDHPTTVGASTLIPNDGDHIVLKYTLMEEQPSC